MPDTLVQPNLPAVQASSPRSVLDLPRAVIAAVRPLVNPKRQEALRPGKTRIDVLKALIPVFSGFTVADAAHAHALLRSVRDATPNGGDTTGAEWTALYEAMSILEDFIVTAFPTGPDCVSALALILAMYEEDSVGEPVLGDALHCAGVKQLARVIGDLRINNFRMSETFDKKAYVGGSGLPDWTHRSCVKYGEAGGDE